MSDKLTSNPVYVDQFNADITLAEGSNPFIVKKIRLLSAAQWDLFFLEDFDGKILFRMENSVGNARMTEADFGDEGFNFSKNGKGVRIDYSDCTGLDATDGTDAVWFYMK